MILAPHNVTLFFYYSSERNSAYLIRNECQTKVQRTYFIQDSVNHLLLLDWIESMGISKEYWMSGRNWLGGRHQLVLLKQARECLLVEFLRQNTWADFVNILLTSILLIFIDQLAFMLLEYDDETDLVSVPGNLGEGFLGMVLCMATSQT